LLFILRQLLILKIACVELCDDTSRSFIKNSLLSMTLEEEEEEKECVCMKSCWY